MTRTDPPLFRRSPPPSCSPTSRPKVVELRPAEALGFLSAVVAPTVAKGVILRRPFVMPLAGALDVDARAVRHVQALRERHGEALLVIRTPLRVQAVPLSGEDAARVLAETPEPFSPASDEKRAALSHFQPHGSLVTTGRERRAGRRFSEAVLREDAVHHPLADRFAGVVAEEAATLLKRSAGLGEMNWTLFSDSFARLVRRVVLGDGAAGDHGLTDALKRLRGRANWAFAMPKNRPLRRAYHAALDAHLARGEAGSLAEIIARRAPEPEAHAGDQVSQWLFAFDPAGMATIRALALLSAHPHILARARDEAAGRAAGGPERLAFLRACLVDTLRLFPTTPMILRQATRETAWGEARLPAGTGFLVYTPFFHRDERRLEAAHRFAPDLWLGRDPASQPPLVPFSAGPGACPGRHLVPMIGALLLAELIAGGAPRLMEPSALPVGRLPGTLDHTRLRFSLEAA